MRGGHRSNFNPSERTHHQANTIVEVMVNMFTLILVNDVAFLGMDVIGAGDARSLIAIADKRSHKEPRQHRDLITCVDGEGGMVIPIRHTDFI